MSEQTDERESEVSAAVLETVSDATGRPAEDLPSLYDAIDPDALDSLFRTTMGGTRRHGSVSFSYAGRTVTVRKNGDLQVLLGDGS